MTAPAPHSNTIQPTQLMTNVIRVLAMDIIQQANSGHPGASMGMVDTAVAPWSRHLRHNPLSPRWPDRDRFVLSNGHGSMLAYVLPHLTGYDLSMSELKNFRQLHSKTAGHPEYGITSGAETTTGLFGQGITNAVGMALARCLLGQEFNRPGFNIVNHHTYVFLGDGCLMEGISHEVCPLAGMPKLNKLVVSWDDNGISIDGDIVYWFSDDTPKCFEAYGWNVIRAADGHNVDAMDVAIAEAKKSDKSTLTCCRTLIGKGAPNKEGGHDVHGALLGGAEVAVAREALAWSHASFEVPQAVYGAWDAKGQGQALEKAWNALFDVYPDRYPAEAEQFECRMRGELPTSFEKAVDKFIEKYEPKAETIVTRKVSQNTLETYAPALGELLGDLADLTGSNLTNWSGSKVVRVDAWGNHINYGVREFGMNAIMNGITLHGGHIPYGGTPLTFSDYSRNTLHMAALMKIRPISVFTHGSIGLGEDGPTHQPIGHVASLRLTPNMDVWYIVDTTETAVARVTAIERQNGSSCPIFSRQNLPSQARSPATCEAIARGGYVLCDAASGKPDVVIIATDSEVGLAVDAIDQLATEGTHMRAASVPATTVFDKQDSVYKASVLSVGVPRVAAETGVTDFWWKHQVQAAADIDTLSESIPAGVLFKYFGFMAENVVNTVKSVIAQLNLRTRRP